MLRAEHRQGDSETQIGQDDDLVQAAGPRDIGLRSPERNKEKHGAGAAHRNRRARELQQCGQNGYVHVDATRKLACLYGGTLSRVNTASNCTTKSS